MRRPERAERHTSEDAPIGAGCSARIEDGYVTIDFESLPDTVEEAEALQFHLTTFFVRNRVRRVIWDTRRAPPNAEAGKACMWQWLKEGSRLKASAFLAQSSMLRVSANMRALSGGMRVRSFAEPAAAREWIRKQPID
jgi:hypothetical protein